LCFCISAILPLIFQIKSFLTISYLSGAILLGAVGIYMLMVIGSTPIPALPQGRQGLH
jgi:hypothetical protein